MRVFPQTREQLLEHPFLTGIDWPRFQQCLDRVLSEVEKGDSVLCVEEDRVEALAVVFGTILKNGGVFLANSVWGESEWRQVRELVNFERVYGSCPIKPGSRPKTRFEEPRIMVPSGGTSGNLRFCVHTLGTLSAAVESLYEFHGRIPLNSINPLPVFHVSGFMPIIRACLTGGKTRMVSWKDMEEGRFPPSDGGWCSISLVPTQLSRLIRSEPGLRFLHRFDAIYVGGAGVSPDLIRFIRTEKLPVLFTYGMTETAAMAVVGSRADTDAAGKVWGQPLPGVEVSLTENQEIHIRTDALFRGYYPDEQVLDEFSTGDVGSWMPDQQLLILGRQDYIINTGGEKVSPEEVEAVLTDLLPGIALAVTSRKDPDWGEQVVAVLESEESEDRLHRVRTQLASCLAPHKIPKVFLVGQSIPRNSLGKINRAVLRESVVEEADS